MQVGVILQHTAFGEPQDVIIRNINEIVETTTHDPVIFSYNISTRTREPLCAVCPLVNMSSVTDGVLIANDLMGAQAMLAASTPAKKIFFVWNLEWIYREMPYKTLRAVLGHDDAVIIARSELHKQAIEFISGKTVDYVMRDFDLEGIIYEVCERERTQNSDNVQERNVELSNC
jgi:hypothetical protein